MSEAELKASAPHKQMSDVLIVDDEGELRELLALEIRDLGYQVTEAASGREAKLLLMQTAFRLVISDLTMADGNGLDLAQWINAENCKAKLVIVSGNVNPALRKSLKNAGVIGVLEKPYSTKDLAKILQQIFTYQADL